MDWIGLNGCKDLIVEIADLVKQIGQDRWAGLVELFLIAEKLSIWLSGLKWVKFVFKQGV